MSPEAALVDQADAQRIFDALPESMRIPSLSPGYVAADARRDPLLSPRFLVWRRGTAVLMHAVHEARIPGRDESDWQSAYGYGGPLAAEVDDHDLQSAWLALDAIARDRRIVAEFVRFHPLVGNQRLYPGTVRADRPVVVLDLTPADLLGSYSGRARTAVRKALNEGLAVRWDTPVEAKSAFPRFYREGMRQIAASDFYLFTDAYFDALLDLPGARVSSVVRDGVPLAMGLFLFGPRVAEYHLSAASAEGRQANATNLLLHGAAQAAREAGLTSLYLGGGTTPDVDNPLLWFKTSYAPAGSSFFIGSRIHDPATYADLRAAFPDPARASLRVLFYRS